MDMSSKSSCEDIKKRKPNWTDTEMSVLSEAVSENIKFIRAKFSPSVTNESKNAVWRSIAERVNSVSYSCIRTMDEVKKRWQDAQSIVKRKESNRAKLARGTGGGPPPETVFKPWELIILTTLSPIAIHGLDGGVDTSRGCDSKEKAAKKENAEVPEESSKAISTPTDSTESSVFVIATDLATTSSASDTVITESTSKPKKVIKDAKKKPCVVDIPAEFLKLKKEKIEKDEVFRSKLLALEGKKVLALAMQTHK